MPERVLQLLGPSTGGIRRHVVALSEALRRRGWEVEVAGPPGVLDGLASLDHDIPIGGPGPVSLVRALRALHQACDGVDLVHAHGLTAGWIASLLRARPPVVLTLHNRVLDEVAGWAAPALRVLERALPARVEAVVAVSHDLARTDGVTVIPPLGPFPLVRTEPARVRADLGIDARAPLVACVARLHAQKGLPTLLDAAVLLRAEVPAARVVVVGDGPLGDELHRRADALGLGDVVVFAGARPDATDVIAAADVLAVPSVWESGPLVVAEALWLGVPVVTTRVGFVEDLVEPPTTGQVVPVGDPPALATALARALTGTRHPDAAERGRRRVEALLGEDVLVPPLEAVYRRVLEQRCAAS